MSKFNQGKLKGLVSPGNNIVYFRRGEDELSLNITNNCPNACIFCIRDRDVGWGVSNLYLDKDPEVDAILEEFDKVNAKMRAKGVDIEKVKICGYGEPILRFNDLYPIVKHIHKHSKALVQLTTTGWPYFRFITQDTRPLKALKVLGLTHIFLGLNATTPEQYNRIVRPGIEDIDKNAFADTLRFARTTKDIGYEVTLGFVRTKGLKREEIEKLSTELGCPYKIREFEK